MLSKGAISFLVILLLVQTVTVTETDVNVQGCEIKEERGFLKYTCDSDDDIPTYRCHNTEEYYQLQDYSMEGSVCSNDPHFYQACDKKLDGFTITNNEILCGNWLCRIVKDGLHSLVNETRTLQEMKSLGIYCDGTQNCKNNEDEGDCEATVTLRSGLFEVDISKICNGRCEVMTCEDEAVCNGLVYGMYCTGGGMMLTKEIQKNAYIPPYYICDGKEQCVGGEDEADCKVTEDTSSTCTKYSLLHVGETVPVFNHTRCGATDYITDYILYCSTLKKSQTNCTDPTRIGGSCLVDGYLSTISIYVICNNVYVPDSAESICDDNDDIRSRCLDPSPSCRNIHKHLLCDNKADCADGSDENHPTCLKQTRKTCKRRMGNAGELTLPLTWIMDGVQDCADGSDEIRSSWPTCGQGRTERLETSHDKCQNVLVCAWGEPGYVELKDLCDGIETCGNENKVCSASLSDSRTVSKVFLSKERDRAITKLSFCLKGLQNIQTLANNFCITEIFKFPDHQYFGVAVHGDELILPNNKLYCDHVFGEHYVFNSCTGRCKDSNCPLRNIPRYEDCPYQFPNRTGTIANNDYLAFFTKSRSNSYSNRYFVCENRIKCIEYSQVCDLVYDCDDKSDETGCTNQFRCSSSGRLLPKTRKCDENFDCPDFSDECNEQCSMEILQGFPLKIASLLIGILAVLANLVILIKSIKSLKRCATSVAMLNKVFIILISFGDFLIGCYLSVIAIYDMAVFRDGYCRKQIEWMISLQCTTIGVLSTIGSQVSLFAMTGLSIVRLHGIRGPLRVPGKVNLVNSLKATLGVFTILLFSAAIAITPIIRIFENFFVNGVKFADELKIFIAVQEKTRLFKVIEAYYGRMKDTTLSWDMSLRMIRGMFSHEKDYEDHTNAVKKLEFYGNDGVCLFKYFVNTHDPQKQFVWAILLVNFICFSLISMSYILIGFVSRESMKQLSSSQNRVQFNQRNRKMNRRIAIIITTDFCCWIPFIIICAMHYLRVLNAERWYGLRTIFHDNTTDKFSN